ncbi:hypothetical protein M514_23895 [Trichuris suis]|uniref:Uncharacterized protein n=1 Tax=Trichuris suis TaxID=68888 RepID=A0A085N358_9BILA|nr:hypothetical protein M514_23895 [Trichuris suis]KHJ42514.1 hypothetical protein D918_07436 [Trichuris suis]
MIERDPKLNVHDLAEEYQRLKSLKHDASLVENVSCMTSVTGAQAAKVSAPQRFQHNRSEGKTLTTPKGKPNSPCWFCGEWHFARHCPFAYHLCSECGAKEHKEGFCRPKKTGSDMFTQNAHRRKGRARSSGVFSTSAANPNLRKYVTPLVNGYPVQLQLDSGSGFTLVSYRTWEAMGRLVLLETSMEMVDASNHVMQLAAYFECQMSLNNRYGRGRCFVTTQGMLNPLGLDRIE